MRYRVRRCVWCNKPVLPGHATRVFGGGELHDEPRQPCVLEYAHETNDVDLMLNAALALLARAERHRPARIRVPHRPVTGADSGAAAGEWCAGPPTRED